MNSSFFQYSKLWILVILISFVAELFNYGFEALVTGGFLMLLNQSQQFTKLINWYDKGSKIKKYPELTGIWSQLGSYTYRLQKENQRIKKLLTKIVKRFHRSTEAMPDATVVLNEYHEIEWANAASKKILGILTKTDVNQRIDNLIRDPLFFDYLHQKKYDKSLEIKSPINSQIDINIRLVPYDKNRLLLSARDISERNRINAMRKDFVANVTHELRTPLTVLQGHCDILEMNSDNKSQKKSIAAMKRQINRTNNLINDLIQLSKFESKGLEDAVIGRKININKLIKSAVAKYKSMEVDITLKLGDRLELMVNESEFKSLIDNLITNAIRHNNKKVKIEIEATYDKHSAYICVKDNGIGIAQEHIARITERFYRVDTGDEKSIGSGLGLTIIKHIINRHNGQLRITSTLGKGCNFICEFPKSRIVY